MNGVVADGLEAVLILTLIKESGERIEIEAIVDTGSTADLTLPPSLIYDLELQPQGIDDIVLADGSRAVANVFRGSITWFDEVRGVDVLELDGTPLVGMQLMQNCRLTMDIVPDGPFTIVPLETTKE